jgi:AbrB family looped-hinge helix DNA binding protein
METTIKLVRPLRGGQITIPVEFRKKLKISERTTLQIELVGDELHIRPARKQVVKEGAVWARELYERFAVVREEAIAYSETDINSDIDEAIAEVRDQRGSRRI